MDGLTGDEIPSWRADPEISREEDFDFVFKAKVPGFSGELDLKRRGSDRSPTAMATTMLILVAEACLAALTIAGICKLAGAPALPLLIAALAAFAGVMITGTVISFRRGGPQSGPGVMPAHLIPLRPADHDEGNMTVQAVSREAHQNDHGTRKEQKGNKDGQVSRPGADRQRRRRR